MLLSIIKVKLLKLLWQPINIKIALPYYTLILAKIILHLSHEF